MKSIYYVGFTAYQLFVNMYYACKLKNTNVKQVLIWFDDGQADVERLKSIFDKIYIVKDEYVTNNNKYLTRIRVRGYLAKHTFKKMLGTIPNDSVVIVYSDEHFPTYRIMQLFSKSNNNRIVLVEEGVGTYAFHKHSFSVKVLLSELIFGCKGEKNIGVSSMIDSYIVKDPSALPKSKHRGRPVVQQNTIFNDKEWLKKLNVLDKNSKLELSKYSNKKVLFLGQPLETCVGDHKTELRTYNRIVKCFEDNYSIIMKKHPRDKAEKYDYINGKNVCKYFVDHEVWIPVEVIIGEIVPEIIISPFSSAALNLYELGYGKKVIFCYKLFGIKIDDSWFDKYKENKDVYNVSSFEELKKVIEEIGYNPVRLHNEDLTINENKDIDYLNSLLVGSSE